MKKYVALVLGLMLVSVQASEFQKKEIPSRNKVALQIKAYGLAAVPGFASFFCVRALLNTCNFSYSEKIAVGSFVLLTILLQRSIYRLVENYCWVNSYNRLVDYLSEIERNPSLRENPEYIEKVKTACKGLIIWNIRGSAVAEQDKKDIVAVLEKIQTLL